jgi:CRP-like cAMP-binding protein
LQTIPLLAQLNPAEQEQIAVRARMQRVTAGQVIIERGDPPEALFAVATGKLKVVAPRNEGRDATLHILGPGDVFGEVALFQANGRTARVTAIEESVLMVLDRRDFLELIQRSSELSGRLLSLMAKRLGDTIAHFDATTSLDVPARLARKLMLLAEHFGVAEADGVALRLKLSQSDLGDLVDTTRQTVNRLLREWHEAGVLRTDHGRLTVLNMKALRDAAEL